MRMALIKGTVLIASFAGCFVGTAFLALAQSPSAIDRFVGTWTEDESKMKLGTGGVLVFRRTTDGQLEELRGGQVNPQVQAVVFDGKSRVVDANGRKIVWSQQSDSSFQRVSSDKDGHVFLARTLRLATDGRTLTEENAWSLPGAPARKETSVWQREQGDNGLVGTWRRRSLKMEPPYSVRIERNGNGLKVQWASGATETLNLTGQPVAVSGANVINGSMMASKLSNDGGIETTSTRNGAPLGRAVFKLSPDGRMFTHTSEGLGQNATGQSEVHVFVKR